MRLKDLRHWSKEEWLKYREAGGRRRWWFVALGGNDHGEQVDSGNRLEHGEEVRAGRSGDTDEDPGSLPRSVSQPSKTNHRTHQMDPSGSGSMHGKVVESASRRSGSRAVGYEFGQVAPTKTGEMCGEWASKTRFDNSGRDCKAGENGLVSFTSISDARSLFVKGQVDVSRSRDRRFP
jgi:hypothetical protein